MVVLGDGKLMPAAEQAIYGHKAGETFRFDFTYPTAFRVPELSGKTAQFEITPGPALPGSGSARLPARSAGRSPALPGASSS